RIVGEAREDGLTGEAAKVAYYFFLSIWPLFLGLFAFTGIFGGEPAFEWIMGWVQKLLPEAPTRFLERYVREITEQSRPDMLSLGVVLLLWSGSSIFTALADGLNTIYDIGEGRTWWRKRLLALGLMAAASILLTGGASAILVGEGIVESLGLSDLYNLARWPVAFVLLTALLWLVYYFLPNRDQDMSKRYVAIGAVTGSTLWVLVTTGFHLYVTHFGSYGRTYGLVGAMLVILIWLYLTALAILFGGEVAVSLEQGLHEDG
ncbi:MAG TPA: YihY/virulence factor BrkB family protein, partial [Gemmatimonadota bacterium]|nr:YihY/virulence factor BrkB family protein [Gemmatimonadota bacterium]